MGGLKSPCPLLSRALVKSDLIWQLWFKEGYCKKLRHLEPPSILSLTSIPESGTLRDPEINTGRYVGTGMWLTVTGSRAKDFSVGLRINLSELFFHFDAPDF